VAYPMWLGMTRSRAISGPPQWLLLANPFYLAYLPYIAPGWIDGWDYARFFAATLGPSVVLVCLAVWRMRPASVRVRGRAEKIQGLGVLGRLTRKLPAPSLDGNPVFWREWHRSRPSTWMVILLAMTVGTATLTCIIASFALWREGVEPNGGSVMKYAGVYSYVLLVPFGLLMLSAVAPMSLSEERQRGSLDVLMTTTLSTRTIVMGKWLGTFRLVPWLVIGPGLVTLALATGPHSPQPDTDHLTLLERVYGSGLMVATILAHGAAITSVGLFLATWIRRQSRAIAVSVTLFVLVSLGWPFLVMTLTGRPMGPPIDGMTLSPMAVAVFLLDGLSMRGSRFRSILREATIWDFGVSVVALALLQLTVRTFDRRLGRISDPRRPIADAAVKDKPPVHEAIYVGD
jgi:ABC-type transport system involved in multi-copper enzyme maturation permease subunit